MLILKHDNCIDLKNLKNNLKITSNTLKMIKKAQKIKNYWKLKKVQEKQNKNY